MFLSFRQALYFEWFHDLGFKMRKLHIYRLIKQIGFTRIPSSTEYNLIQCHFHHFRLIEKTLLFFKFDCDETAPSFFFFLSIPSQVILTRVFPLTERLPRRKHALAGVEPPHRLRPRLLPSRPLNPPLPALVRPLRSCSVNPYERGIGGDLFHIYCSVELFPLNPLQSPLNWTGLKLRRHPSRHPSRKP
jgi:hypothetical protein